MIPIKEYIAKQFINNRYRFTCNCFIPIDVTGIVKDYITTDSEIILLVATDNDKQVRIGLNTASLQVERL
jgi:hypothetical protein